MARTKYKLGQFVKVAENNDCPAAFGAIEEVRLTHEGTVYKIIGLEDGVSEDAIETAYREVTTRKATKAVKGLRTTKRTKTAAEAA